MNFNQSIEKLSLLFPHIELLRSITRDAVIAGGSVVAATNSWVDLEEVGDIDVFAPTVEIFLNIQKSIIMAFPNKSVRVIPMGLARTSDYSIVNIEVEGISTVLQLIYKPFKYVTQLLETFDLDYVQCGLYQGIIYKTARCSASHRDRRIYSFRGTNKVFRKKLLQKATRKGFSASILIADNTFEDVGGVDELIPVHHEKRLLVPLLQGVYSEPERISKSCGNGLDPTRWYELSTVIVEKIIISFEHLVNDEREKAFNTSSRYNNIVCRVKSLDRFHVGHFTVSAISYNFKISNTKCGKFAVRENPLQIQKLVPFDEKQLRSLSQERLRRRDASCCFLVTPYYEHHPFIKCNFSRKSYRLGKVLAPFSGTHKVMPVAVDTNVVAELTSHGELNLPLGSFTLIDKGDPIFDPKDTIKTIAFPLRNIDDFYTHSKDEEDFQISQKDQNSGDFSLAKTEKIGRFDFTSINLKDDPSYIPKRYCYPKVGDFPYIPINTSEIITAEKKDKTTEVDEDLLYTSPSTNEIFFSEKKDENNTKVDETTKVDEDLYSTNEIITAEKKDETITNTSEDMVKDYIKYFQVFSANYESGNKNKALLATIKAMFDDLKQ